MYAFSIERIRLDLGNDVFTDAIISQEVQNTFSSHENLNDLISEIKTFAADRDGEYVEFDGSHFVLDTKETTIYGMVLKNDEVIADDEIETVDEKFKSV